MIGLEQQGLNKKASNQSLFLGTFEPNDVVCRGYSFTWK